MPNHTENYLEITTPTKHVDTILGWLRNSKNQFSYEGLVPMPELIRNTGCGSRDFDGVRHTSWHDNQDGESRPFTDEELVQLKQIGHDNWHDWAYANWGVKWDAYSTGGDAIEIERQDYSLEGQDMTLLEVRFTSPWGPPEVWFRTLRDKLEELTPDIEATLQYRLEDDPYYPHEL